MYAFNLNATRNLAIEDGFQTGATWVMPWDGQCFLTRSGFSEILEAAANNPDARYLLVPIARFTDNHVVLRPDFTIKAVEEPQVIFRRDARDRFDERLRYANMNKAEFLIRIGLPGDWNRWPRTPWEAQYPSASDAGKYAYAGWVARLASETSRNVDETGRGREVGRYAGIAVHCAGLDARLIEAARAKSALNCYQPFLADLAPGRAAAMALVRVAEDRLATAPSGLADAVAGDDHTRQRNAIDSVTVLAIAAEFTRKVVYAEHAAALARRWLIGGGAGVNPRLDLAEGVVDFRDVWALCDALTLLERRGMLTEADSAGLKAWFEPVRAQLAKWGGAFGRMDAVGVFHDLAVASAAAYCGDTAALAGVLARAPLRLHRQIEPGGWLPGEAAGTRPLHRALFALQGLIALAWLGRNCGIDLWRYAGAGHRSIPMAANFIAANRAMFSDYAADRAPLRRSHRDGVAGHPGRRRGRRGDRRNPAPVDRRSPPPGGRRRLRPIVADFAGDGGGERALGEGAGAAGRVGDLAAPRV
ncbi:MAG: alginate lyase family protein [Bauldia sp.]